MTNGNLHQIWVEQCVAAETIKLRYGLKAAFDYAVAEKLLNFAEAAAQHPEFARELPRFVSRVRQMFTAQELVVHLARIERERRENDLAAMEDDDAPFENPAAALERTRQFDPIKELLTANMLGAVLHQSPDKRGVPLPVKMVSQLTQTWHSQVRSFC